MLSIRAELEVSPCLLDSLREVGPDEDVLDGGEGHEEVLAVDAPAVLPHPPRLQEARAVRLAGGGEGRGRGGEVEEADVVALQDWIREPECRK